MTPKRAMGPSSAMQGYPGKRNGRSAQSNGSINSGDDQSCLSQNTKGILKSNKSRNRHTSRLSGKKDAAGPRVIGSNEKSSRHYRQHPSNHDLKSYRDFDKQSHLVDPSKSYRRSNVSSHREQKFGKHKGYDRPINPVPIDVIPKAAQNCRVVYTKHIYPHYNSKLKVEDQRSKWAPHSYMQQQMNSMHDQAQAQQRAANKQCRRSRQRADSLRSCRSSKVSRKSGKKPLSSRTGRSASKKSVAKSARSRGSHMTS